MSDFLEEILARKARSKAANPDHYYDLVSIDDLLCCSCNQSPWFDGAWWEDPLIGSPETLELECDNCGAEIRLQLDWTPEVTQQQLASEEEL